MIGIHRHQLRLPDRCRSLAIHYRADWQSHSKLVRPQTHSTAAYQQHFAAIVMKLSHHADQCRQAFAIQATSGIAHGPSAQLDDYPPSIGNQGSRG
jgi:hypothetical protein